MKIFGHCASKGYRQLTPTVCGNFDFFFYQLWGEITFLDTALEALHTGWPVIHGHVFLLPYKKWLVQCTVAYTGQVTFYKVREKHGHVYLVKLYKKIIKWLYKNWIIHAFKCNIILFFVVCLRVKKFALKFIIKKFRSYNCTLIKSLCNVEICFLIKLKFKIQDNILLHNVN